MKKFFIPCIMGLAFSCLQQTAFSQQFREHISREFVLNNNNAKPGLVAIYNITGSIKVEGYAGDKILFEVDKILSAGDNNKLESAKNSFKLTFDQHPDSIVAYVSAPYDSRPYHNQDTKNFKAANYAFNLDFTIKVPFNMNIEVFTVNSGKITVNDVAGVLRAGNVNGDITITNAQGVTEAQSADGDLTINYLKKPASQSSYSTIEGDIHVSYPVDLSADMVLKSMTGEFSTDFEVNDLSLVKAEKSTSPDGKVTVRKLEKQTALRVGQGAGETVLKFQTLSGNIYVMKQSN